MKLILVRHGQDDPACRGGWSDHDLTPEGAQQAKALAARLKACREAYSLAAVITSDLPRAVTTAEILADALSLPVVKEPRLREINNGELAGMANETALKRYPGLFFSTLQMDEAYPKGESPRAFHDRIKNWFEELAACRRDEPGTLVIVTHGGVISILYHLIKGIPWSNSAPAFKAAPCCAHLVDLTDMTYKE